MNSTSSAPKDRPILFSTPMVQAILAGQKTMTRRVIKPQPTDEWMQNTKQFSPNGSMYDYKGKNLYWIDSPKGEIVCPYGKPGDVLWVRECAANLNIDFPDQNPYWVYKADLEHPNQHGPVTWKPSIHMPKSACRIWLEVTEVRVERLQAISEIDAEREGVEDYDLAPLMFKQYGKNTGGCNSAVASFMTLWESINGPESWESNPWVWVISFKRIEKEESTFNSSEIADEPAIDKSDLEIETEIPNGNY